MPRLQPHHARGGGLDGVAAAPVPVHCQVYSAVKAVASHPGGQLDLLRNAAPAGGSVVVVVSAGLSPLSRSLQQQEEVYVTVVSGRECELNVCGGARERRVHLIDVVHVLCRARSPALRHLVQQRLWQQESLIGTGHDGEGGVLPPIHAYMNVTVPARLRVWHTVSGNLLVLQCDAVCPEFRLEPRVVGPGGVRQRGDADEQVGVSCYGGDGHEHI
mmetsp:Transcript_5647/g.12431  ORF Transcript_5647/g.12431 Transcript_5647/m.12431 type:complete len:216 (-) Transcript_5647:159-806(-)